MSGRKKQRKWENRLPWPRCMAGNKGFPAGVALHAPNEQVSPHALPSVEGGCASDRRADSRVGVVMSAATLPSLGLVGFRILESRLPCSVYCMLQGKFWEIVGASSSSPSEASHSACGVVSTT